MSVRREVYGIRNACTEQSRNAVSKSQEKLEVVREKITPLYE